MFGRFVVSALLIAIGIASPWLVQDWLHWHDGGESRLPFDRFEDFKKELKLRAAHLGEDLIKKQKSSDANSVTKRMEHVSLVDSTKRILEGLIPTSQEVGRAPPVSVESAGWKLDEGRLEAVKNSLPEGLMPGDEVFIRVFKEENDLELWMRSEPHDHFTLCRVFQIRGWSGDLGPKLKEGDRQTPEGFYYVTASQMRPETRHYLGIDLGFPNHYDQHQGRSGSDILIHGGESHSGAFALGTKDMGALFDLTDAALSHGQRLVRVNIFPFRMTDQRMTEIWEKQPDWIDFWVNLKEGYDFFENVNYPPDVRVESGKYVFRLH